MKQRFHEWKQPVFDRDGWTRFGWRCQYPEGLRLGDQVDIGCFSYLNAREGIIIGDDVQIGSHCSIYSVDTERGVSGEVVIGAGSLIGSYSLILPGTRIKSFCKVKARSIIKGEQENIKQIE